jgi:Rrf2 family protein
MFSKSCKYAIRAVLFLAINSSEDKKLGAKEIADELDIPKHFLAKILQQLSRHDLIASTKGTGGGFYLAENNLHGNLEAIIECMDGQAIFTSCILGLPVCSSENPCPLHHKFLNYREGLKETVSNQTIKDLATKVVSKRLTI